MEEWLCLRRNLNINHSRHLFVAVDPNWITEREIERENLLFKDPNKLYAHQHDSNAILVCRETIAQSVSQCQSVEREA